MDALSDVLQPYKDIVGNVAVVTIIGQMFSGSFICWDVYKQGNTRGISNIPSLGGFVICILSVKFGYIIQDSRMIQVNIFGTLLNMVHVMIYLHYSAPKKEVWRQIYFTGVFSAVLLGYAQMEDTRLVEDRFGTILTAVVFALIAYPLFGLRDIIKNQSTEGMPFPMILSFFIASVAWLLYGVILRNEFLVIQNIVAVALCTVQLALFVIYPSTSKESHINGKSTSKRFWA